MLLTQQPLKLDSSIQLEEPRLHALAMVDRIEPDPVAKQMRIVHAHVNLGMACLCVRQEAILLC